MLVCNECSSSDVQIMVWFNPNTEEVKGDSENEPWCEDCECHVSLKEK